jgi:hypothetical protein
VNCSQQVSRCQLSGWLAPLEPALATVTGVDLDALGRFEDDLASLLDAYPIGGDVEPGLRSERLRRIRAATAARGHLGLAVASRHGGVGRPAVVQALMQFICGYYDVDLRDSSGLGHGQLIAEGSPGKECACCGSTSPDTGRS